MKNRKALLLAFVCACLVFVIFGSIILKTQPRQNTPSNPSYQYVVPKTDIKKGDTIKEEDIEIKDFQVNIEGAYKATGEIIGRTANVDMSVGKPIVKDFIAVIDTANKAKGVEPVRGFRAVPVLIRKDVIPPYLTVNSRFDLFTRENLMKIENVRILNIMEPSDNANSKMIVLEIKNGDIPLFIEYQNNTKGFIFVKKNPDDNGSYKFHDLAYSTIKNSVAKLNSYSEIIKNPPQIEKLPPEIQEYGFEDSSLTDGKRVEVIVGNKKTKMEF